MKKREIALTKFELEVMELFWRLGEASVRQVHDAVEHGSPAYTTIQTIVQRLEQKGAVRRTRKIGNALLFEAVVTKKSAYRRIIGELLDLVGGSRPLVAHLMESGKLSLDDLKAIEKAQRGKR